MARPLWLLVLLSAGCAAHTPPAPVSAPRARNVILFLADAGGLPTLHAAAVHASGDPRKLFLRGLPHVALSETSSASQWGARGHGSRS